MFEVENLNCQPLASHSDLDEIVGELYSSDVPLYPLNKTFRVIYTQPIIVVRFYQSQV